MAAAPDGKLRWVLAAASIVKCQWGIGMMAMPFMLQQAGLLTGVVQFSISMLITCDAVFRLIAVKAWVLQGRQKGGGGGGSVNDALLGEPAAGHLAESRSKRMLTTREVDQAIAGGIAGGILTLDYNGIIKAVLGPAWEFVSLVAIVVSCYGSNIAYVIFISGNLTQFLGPAVPLVAWQWALLSMVPFLALATGKDVVFLAPFGVLGLCCALSFWGVMLYDAFSTISWVHFTAWAAAAPQLEVKTLPIAVSIAAFCNEGVVIMALNVQDSMREPSRFSSAMVSALVFFAVCYLMLGVAGLSLYHANTNCDKPGVAHQVCSPISRAMCAIDSNTTATQKFCEAGTSRVRTAAVVLYAMQLVPTYAIVYWCSYESWENYYLRWASIPRGGAKHASMKWSRFVPVRWAGILFTGVFALYIPNFGDFLALIGACANSLGIYILPHVCWLKIFGGSSDRSWPFMWRYCVSVAMLVFGVCLAIYGTWQSLADGAL